MLKPILTPQAHIDLAESLTWYTNNDVATADRFDKAVNDALERLCEHPDRWPKLGPDTRACIVNGFPFSIVYYVHHDSLVVVAIAHHSRNPDYWRKK